MTMTNTPPPFIARILALDAFLQHYGNVNDVFDEMLQSKNTELEPFAKWEREAIDLTCVSECILYLSHYSTRIEIDTNADHWGVLQALQSVFALVLKTFKKDKENKMIVGITQDSVYAYIVQTCDDNAFDLWWESHESRLPEEQKLDSILKRAAEVGNLTMVNKLLKHITPLNQTLHAATTNGHLEIVNRLLEYPDIIPNRIALYEACYGGHYEVVKRLLQVRGSLENYPLFDEYNVLSGATLGGHYNMVELLLQYPEISTPLYVTHALVNASFEGYTHIVNQLLVAGADPTFKHMRALRRAAHNNKFETVQQLLADPRVNPAVSKNYVLRQAIKHRHPIMHELLQHPKVIKKLKPSSK